MSLLDTFSEKGMYYATKIQNNKVVNAISQGLMATMPIMIIGSLSTLLSALQWEPYQNFIAPVRHIIALPATFTINVLAIYTAFSIAYKYATSYNKEGIIPAFISLFSFLVMTPISIFEVGEMSVNAMTFDWLGAQGLFAAMIVAIVSTRLYIYFTDKNWTIKMPEGVPPTIAATFSGLVPAVLVSTIFTIISGLFSLTEYGSFHQMIYTILQVPLQALGGSIWSLLIALLAMQVLWVMGIHGAMLVMSIINPIYSALSLENLTAYQAGEPMPNLVTGSFWSLYANFSPMLGLIVVLLFFTKSKQFNIIGKLGAPGALFGIHEPIIFGLPIVMNPILAIPYILSPIVCVIIGYIITVIGIVPIPIGMSVPFGTPIVVAGFLHGSWTFALAQVLLIPICALIYYPFVKILDKKNLEQESSEVEVLGEMNSNTEVVKDL